ARPPRPRLRGPPPLLRRTLLGARDGPGAVGRGSGRQGVALDQRGGRDSGRFAAGTVDGDPRPYRMDPAELLAPARPRPPRSAAAVALSLTTARPPRRGFPVGRGGTQPRRLWDGDGAVLRDAGGDPRPARLGRRRRRDVHRPRDPGGLRP